LVVWIEIELVQVGFEIERKEGGNSKFFVELITQTLGIFEWFLEVVSWSF